LFFKISLGLFFLRILVKKWQRRTVYGAVVIASFVSFCYFWFAIFQCGVPNDSFWEKIISHQCPGDRKSVMLGVSYTHATITALTDLTLAFLPVPILIKLRIPFKEKVVVSSIMLMATM
jgi:hypothetical protein